MSIKKPKLTREQIRQGLDSIPMDSILLGTATEARLTHKQKEFARMVAMGETKAGAYRKAYNSKGNSKTVATKGYEMAKRDDIAAMTQAFAQAKQFTDSHTPAQLRAFVIQQLASHAANEDNPPSVRLTALKTLGTVSEVAAFTERKEVTTIKQSGDLRDRIAEKLKLIGSGVTIEHNSQQDDEQDAESLLNEINQTHTIDAGEAIDDELIPEYRVEIGLSHDIGIESDATGSESPQAEPTVPTHPSFRGVNGAEATHIIPHNQLSDESIPHNHSPVESDSPSKSDVVFDSTVVGDNRDFVSSANVSCNLKSVGADGSIATIPMYSEPSLEKDAG